MGSPGGHRRRRDERGAVAIMFAVLAIVIFVFAAMVVDIGMASDTKTRAQSAADASALAAGGALYRTSSTPDFAAAVSAVTTYAQVNYGTTAADWSACTDAGRPATYYVVPGTSPCISFDSSTQPKNVRVVVPTRNVDATFGRIVGISKIPVSVLAQSAVSSSTTVSCGLCFLGDVDSGNADYTVTGGGSIAVSGDVDLGANGHMTASKVAVGGTWNPGDGFSPKPVVDIDPFADPLAALTLPVGNAGLSAKSNPCTNGPGVYGDYAVNGTCTLPSGLYIITGTWSLKNNDLLTNAAAGVTLYFTCGTATVASACPAGGAAGGQLFGKNGDYNLSARSTNTADITGFSVVYDRNNTASLQLQGNGNGKIKGGVYARRSALDYNGNSCFTIDGGPVVVDSVIKANGNKSCVNVTNAVGVKAVDIPGAVSLNR